MRWLWLGVILSVLLAVFIRPLLRRHAYEAGGLAPHGGGVVKDMAAWSLTSLPALGRLFRQGPTPSEMEGWHFAKRESPHFAENFYFWANSRDSNVRFLYTIRMSFYGVNASHIVPWFYFVLDGESWSIPAQFESMVAPHKSGSSMEASCSLGTLRFVCEVPMQRWRISYTGQVQNVRSGESRLVEAVFQLNLREDNVFNFNADWDELGAARAIAGVPWTTSFWRNLLAQNQERYSSLADTVEGQVTFEGGTRQDLVLDGSRDHNNGIRNWRFIHRYIWWPPVRFEEPLHIDGVHYTYLTGAMTEYGNTFRNLVVGGLVAKGATASFSGATPMNDIAQRWYGAPPSPGRGIGDETLPSEFHFQIAILSSSYVLNISIVRGTGAGLWQHSFLMHGGDFEIHEGLSKWTFKLHRHGDPVVLQETTAIGLFEFGANLVGYDEHP